MTTHAPWYFIYLSCVTAIISQRPQGELVRGKIRIVNRKPDSILSRYSQFSRANQMEFSIPRKMRSYIRYPLNNQVDPTAAALSCPPSVGGSSSLNCLMKNFVREINVDFVCNRNQRRLRLYCKFMYISLTEKINVYFVYVRYYCRLSLQRKLLYNIQVYMRNNVDLVDKEK